MFGLTQYKNIQPEKYGYDIEKEDVGSRTWAVYVTQNTEYKSMDKTINLNIVLNGDFDKNYLVHNFINIACGNAGERTECTYEGGHTCADYIDDNLTNECFNCTDIAMNVNQIWLLINQRYDIDV
jgi:hypothetical protein